MARFEKENIYQRTTKDGTKKKSIYRKIHDDDLGIDGGQKITQEDRPDGSRKIVKQEVVTMRDPNLLKNAPNIEQIGTSDSEILPEK